MSAMPARRNREPLYNASKTIRNVQDIPDITPLRLLRVFYPLYNISVRGTHYFSKPFEFIEKYIESYLQACANATSQELATFFGLRLNMVEKILYALVAIKHVTLQGERYVLTPLGQESLVREQKRLGDDQWGQKLFFDAYFLKPLPRTHSSESKMHILSRYEALTISNESQWYNPYYCLSREVPWEDIALDQLLTNVDRVAFNLPDEITNLKREALELVYIPMHIVVAHKHGASQRSTRYYIPFTHTHERGDTFFETLINQPHAGHLNAIQSALHAEDVIEQLNDFWGKWQQDTNVTGGDLQQLPNGTWQVNVVARDIYSSHCKLRINRIGSYWVEKGYFIRIWSNDANLRREAVFESVIGTIRSHSGTLTLQVVQQQLSRFSKNLQTDPLRMNDLQRYAEEKTDHADIVQALENIDENL